MKIIPITPYNVGDKVMVKGFDEPLTIISRNVKYARHDIHDDDCIENASYRCRDALFECIIRHDQVEKKIS